MYYQDERWMLGLERRPNVWLLRSMLIRAIKWVIRKTGENETIISITTYLKTIVCSSHHISKVILQIWRRCRKGPSKWSRGWSNFSVRKNGNFCYCLAWKRKGKTYNGGIWYVECGNVDMFSLSHNTLIQDHLMKLIGREFGKIKESACSHNT